MPAIPAQIIKSLEELKQNNNREWYEERKEKYNQLLQAFKIFGEAVETEINTFDQVRRLKVYRPYRDLRFSKDKTPYHIYRGISFFIEGRGEYYINIEPGNCYLMVGYLDVSPPDLKRLREEFDYDIDEISRILSEQSFNTYFEGLLPVEVKTAPKGFDRSHPHINFIKKKALMVKRRFSDAEITQPDFYHTVIDTFKTGRPLLRYINDVLSTDSNGMPLES